MLDFHSLVKVNFTEYGAIGNWDTINTTGTQTSQKDYFAFFSQRILLLLQAGF